jgi:hypothetical protein
MLRISELESGAGKAVLRLEGKLVGRWVDELEALCAETKAGDVMVSLDLVDLAFADRRGVALLRRLRGAGMTIERSSPLLTKQLKG